MKVRFLLCLLPLLGFTTACVAGDDSGGGMDKINGSIHVEAGQAASDASTINGSIRLAPNAQAQSVSTVNGAIALGDRAHAKSLETVNGSITLGDGAQIAKSIESVNGALTLSPGAEVEGSATNVNGHISLNGAHIGGGIETVDGDIDVTGNARVDGGLVVHKPDSGWFHFGTEHIPQVVIGPGATVNGTLKFEREVKLYVSDRAHVGEIVGATPVKFTGAEPPAND
ncbi:MAG TPA: hypothetical protein VN725_02895 [Rhodanobacteraceae bacterium]|nr:hypothetical protein [Rhodanobacteraceae bacterium]